MIPSPHLIGTTDLQSELNALRTTAPLPATEQPFFEFYDETIGRINVAERINGISEAVYRQYFDSSNKTVLNDETVFLCGEPERDHRLFWSEGDRFYCRELTSKQLAILRALMPQTPAA